MHLHVHPGVVQYEISNRKAKNYSKWIYMSIVIPKALTCSPWNHTKMKSV